MTWDPNSSVPPPWDGEVEDLAPAATAPPPAQAPQPPLDEESDDRPPEDADPLLRIREERESEEIQQLREQGHLALNLLSQLIRNYQLYSADNAIFERPLADFYEQLVGLFERLGEVRLVVVEGQPYVGDLRIRTDATSATAVTFLGQWLQRHGLGGWAFGKPPSEETLSAFLSLVSRARFRTSDPVGGARIWLRRLGFDWMEPIPPQRFREEGEEELDEEGGLGRANQAFEQGVCAARGFFGMLEKTGVGSVLDARKAIQFVVDLAIEEQDTNLAVGLMAELGDPLLTHSMHVANLAVAMGRELGVPRQLLAELGLCGLLHDTGLSELPPEIGELPGTDYDLMRVVDHPVLGFRLQLRQRGYHLGRLLRAVVSLEHHLEFAGTRHEAWDDARRPIHPFSRVVAVAEAYDTLLTDTESRPAMLPGQALREVWRGRKRRFDPVAVQALVNLMGRHPVGSTLQLSDGSAGVVVARGRGARGFDRPVVRVAHDGGRLRRGEAVDLAEVPATEIGVLGAVDPGLLGIDVLDVLFYEDEDGEGGEATRGTSR